MEKENNSDRKPENQGKQLPGWVRPLVLVLVVLALFISARVFGFGEKIGLLRDWIESLGTLGMLVFVFVYVAATVAAMPGSAITVAAGALFGSFYGVILVSAGSTAGAALSFLISRYFARESIVRWLGEKKIFKRLDSLTVQHGAVIVALTRLVPIFPFNILNYGFGITRVKFADYVLWSWLCMLPMTIVFVVGADAVTKSLAQGTVPWPLIGVALGVLAALVIVVRIARKKLMMKETSTDTGDLAGEETPE